MLVLLSVSSHKRKLHSNAHSVITTRDEVVDLHADKN